MDVNLEPAGKDPHQPSPAWAATLQRGNPDQPLIWTEDQVSGRMALPSFY
jgi:hypothetical protein